VVLIRVVVLALSASLVQGCAGASTGAGSGGDPRNLITQAHIEETEAQTAYQLVSILRPEWLGDRGSHSWIDPAPTLASVYADGFLMGTVEVLRNIHANEVQAMRYHPPGPAAVRFGMGHPRGAIEVLLKGR